MKIDPVILAQELIRFPSITPNSHGVIEYVGDQLRALGFDVNYMTFGDHSSPPVDNLYATRGEGKPHICFAGHTDVVPTGAEDMWSVPPFAGEVKDWTLIGRGAVDMKGAVAAFIAAVTRLKKQDCAISILLTNDEEGPAINGTRKVLDWMEENKIFMDACLVGEPTSLKSVGDTIKIGRRGSFHATVIAHGQQGHVAYPDDADNPLPRLAEFLSHLKDKALDAGTDEFDPSNLEIISIDVDNTSSNVIPATGRAKINIRFNTNWDHDKLQSWLHELASKYLHDYQLNCRSSALPFITKPGLLSQSLTESIERVTDITPQLSTSGGTSDARFIHHFCPVVELGLCHKTAHQIDEHAPVKDLQTLCEIYTDFLETFPARFNQA